MVLMSAVEQALASKEGARTFLSNLEQFVNAHLPPPATMRAEVEKSLPVAKTSPDQRHLRFREAAVLNGYVTPLINRFLREQVQLDDEQARMALLSESWGSLKAMASGSPFRSARHPFSKVIGVKPRQVVEQWKSTGAARGLMRSAPDMALRHPAPYQIVFEGKCFADGGRSRAESELVTGLYQAFFYRGLPAIVAKSPKPSWGYEYACLLICDLSQAGHVGAAWRAFDRGVREACWDGANIYVMVIRGTDEGSSR
jgi:hypothetical protein